MGHRPDGLARLAGARRYDVLFAVCYCCAGCLKFVSRRFRHPEFYPPGVIVLPSENTDMLFHSANMGAR